MGSTDASAGVPLPAPLERRMAAWIVDLALLVALECAVGFVIGDAVAPIGAPVQWLGFACFVGYFGLLGSRITGGRTPAKRWLGLAVLDTRSGQPLPLRRALARAAVLASTTPVLAVVLSVTGTGVEMRVLGARLDVSAGGPFMLRSTALPLDAPGVAVVWFGGFGLLLTVASAVLAYSDRQTRQTVHDLLVGTRVVLGAPGGAAPFAAPPEARRRLRRSVTMAAVGATAIAVVALGLEWTILGSTRVPASVEDAVRAAPGVTWHDFREGTIIDAKGVHRALEMVVYYRGPDSDRQVAGKLAPAALRSIPAGYDERRVLVTVARGWQVGFASAVSTVQLTATRN